MWWLYLLAAYGLLTVVAVRKSRHDYRHRGRLTPLGFGVFVVWFFLPHLALHWATRLAQPSTPRQFVGLAVALLGLAVCFAGIITFRSAKKVFTFEHGTLTVSGLYRWSRNPQYVAWLLFLVGAGIMWWTWKTPFALVWLALTIHIVVLVEEEHLRRVFGDAYRDYCARTPRYLGPVDHPDEV